MGTVTWSNMSGKIFKEKILRILNFIVKARKNH